MAETSNEMMDNSTVAETQETRTFTQEELNSIIEGRLKKESAKYADYEDLKAKASKFDEMEEAQKSEIQKAIERADDIQKKYDALVSEIDIRNVRDKVSKDTGVPSDLLLGKTEEECLAQANAILAYKNDNTSSYPVVKDAGEVQNLKHKKSEAEQFAEWFLNATNN